MIFVLSRLVWIVPRNGDKYLWRPCVPQWLDSPTLLGSFTRSRLGTGNDALRLRFAPGLFRLGRCVLCVEATFGFSLLFP